RRAFGEQGLLLAGGSGCGKSTLALILLRAGFTFLGDDMLFLAPASDGLRLLAFPDEINITAQTACLLPELHHLQEGPRKPGWPKHSFRADTVYEAPFVKTCRPAVLGFPTVSEGETSALMPMSAAEHS